MKSRSPLIAALTLIAASTLYGFALPQGARDTHAATTAPSDDKTGQSGNQSALSPGTILVAEFDGGLNAKKLKPGDKVKATLTQDLLAHGRIVAPIESKLIGHVTEAMSQTAEERESRLGIVFDKLLLKHHQELKFLATVQILAPPAPRRSRVDEPDQMLPPSMMGGGRSGPSGPIGRGSAGGGGARPATVGNAGGSLADNLSINSPITVAGNPGSTLGDKNVPTNLPQPASASNKPVSGGQNVRPGVYGIKNLSLGPEDKQTPGPVILSDQATVKLEDGTQVVLRVTGLPATMASK